MVDRKIIFGAALAAGALLVVPGVAATLFRTARPLVKGAIRTGMAAYAEAQRAGAEVYEDFEDLAAEVKDELHAEAEAVQPAPAKPGAAAAGGDKA